MTIILLITFVLLLVLGVPVAFCMLLSSLAALLYAGVDPVMVGLEIPRALNSFYTFLAVPFFILAGEIMSQGGLSDRLVEFVKAMLGHRRSGLPSVTVISSQMFGAVSGASAATCAAIGSTMIPALDENGFPRTFATALAACAGTTGALIPPSIVLIIYGTIAGVSIEKLFIGGIVPGLLIGMGLMAVSARQARKFDVDVEPRSSLWEILDSAKSALSALFLGVIIFVGIMGGIFTATEAAAVAVVYALFMSLFVLRQLAVDELPSLFLSAAKITAALSFLLACASLFGWTLGIGKAPEVVTQALIGGTDSLIAMVGGGLDAATIEVLRRVIVLLVLNVALLCVGMVIDIAPALLIVVPVLLPISEAIGMGSGLAAVQFGVLVVSNLVVGLVTPPVGTTLFVGAAVGDVEVTDMIPHVLRFLPIMGGVQLLITYVPPLTRALPSLM